MVNGRPCCLIVDTGADRTLVRKGVIAARNLPLAPQKMCGVTGHCSAMRGPVEAQIEVGGKEMQLPVYVADLEEPCLLGLDYLTKGRACIDFGKGTLRVHDTEVPLLTEDACPQVAIARSAGLASGNKTRGEKQQRREVSGRGGQVEPADGVPRLPGGRTAGSVAPPAATTGWAARSMAQSATASGRTARSAMQPAERDGDGRRVPEHLREMLQKSTERLSTEQAVQLQRMLCVYADVFSKGDTDLGCTSLVQHRIDTSGSHPIKHAPRRIPPARRQEMEKAVRDLRAQGVIEKSNSPWSSAVVLVKKKDGSTRLCVDYRALNDVTVKDSYPLPRIDDTLDALAGARWFSTLDLKSGYHQVEVADEDKEKTAFSFGQGLWQFRVMPFGLCNAPATFERLMERVLEDLQWKTALVYLDDVVVFGRTFEEELQRLEDVLRRLRQANLKLSPKKCLLFQQEVPFLGHVVGEDGVRTDPLKVRAVAEWPVPTNVGEVRSFVGLCTYYRRFVKDFASIAAPLHHLTRKGARFLWDAECQTAFERLKEALVNAPVLPYPDPACPYIVDCDACAEGVGAVLSQLKDGREHVVAYYSNKFSQAEKNYCVTRKELLAVVKSLENFHPYLYGAKFTVRTDHAALRWLKTMKNPEGQLARWIGRLEQYDYCIEHRPGRVHNNADSLSRRPCEPECHHCSRKEPEEVCRLTRVHGAECGGGTLLQEAQRKDPDLLPVVKWLEAGQGRPDEQEVTALSPATRFYWRQWDTLKMSEGVLVKKWLTPDGGVMYWQTVIPRDMRASLMREMHEGVASGHLGVKKTLSRLRQRFYWLGMRKDVQEWCRVCDTCNAKKGPARKGRAPLQLYQVGAPMERVAVDIVGPLPATAAGNRYICVAMDYFTKWPEAYALPNHEAVTVAEVLVEQFFTRFGVPGELHSDQGREFESEVFSECCQLLGLRKTRTTPLRPQSDGMVERFNRTLAQELAKYCTEGQTEWDQKLPALLMAYRSAAHEATTYTPARLMMGRELRLPVDLTTGRPPDEELPTVATDYAIALQERLVEAHHQVRGRLKLAGEAMRHRYDRGSRAAEFAAGDKVWLYNPRRRKGLSPKLQSPWEGPYTVIEKVSEVTFRIRRGQRGKPKIIHADRLWRYHGPGKFTWGQAPCDRSSEEEEAALDVDAGDVTRPDAGLLGSEDAGAATSEDEDAESVVGDSPPAAACRPPRQRRPPRRLQDYILDEETDLSS